jgi:hypothetical protein
VIPLPFPLSLKGAKLIRGLANCIGAAAKGTGAAVKPIQSNAQRTETPNRQHDQGISV